MIIVFEDSQGSAEKERFVTWTLENPEAFVVSVGATGSLMIHRANCNCFRWFDNGENRIINWEKLCADKQELLLDYCKNRFSGSPKFCQSCMCLETDYQGDIDSCIENAQDNPDVEDEETHSEAEYFYSGSSRGPTTEEAVREIELDYEGSDEDWLGINADDPAFGLQNPKKE